MINALHLLWIIPLSASFGCFTTALCVAASRADEAAELNKINLFDLYGVEYTE